MISMTASCRVVSRWKVSLYRAPFPTRSPVVSFTATQRGNHSRMRIGSEVSPKTFSMAAGMLAEYVKETGPIGAGIYARRALRAVMPSSVGERHVHFETVPGHARMGKHFARLFRKLLRGAPITAPKGGTPHAADL